MGLQHLQFDIEASPTSGEADNQTSAQPTSTATQNAQTPEVQTAQQKAAEASPPGLEDVVFALEPGLHVSEFAAVFRSSTLAERRPLERPDVLERMLRGADVIVTARLRVGGKLIGVARSLTDFAYCTYLSDVAVDTAHQRRGIGKELLRRSHEAAGLHTTMILLAAPRARDYYPHIGMHRHDSCWTYPRYAPPEVLPPSPKGG